MALTKSQVVDLVVEKNGLTRKNANEVVEALIELIRSSLESGDDVLISGFGKFCVKNKKQRKGRNPATGEDMMLDARKIVTFKCSGKLRERLTNNER